MRLLLAAVLVAAFGNCVAQMTPDERPYVPSGRWALVVGVSHYSSELGPLRYTAKEARDFAGELTGNLGFLKEDVRVLADDGAPADAPTSEHVVTALDSMLSDPRLDKGNLFVFYFSGHGIGTKGEDYLLPSDASAAKVREVGLPVEKVITRIVAAGLKNVIFVADACRSGERNGFGTQLIELCRKANIAVMLGCAPGKRSYEYPALKEGAFTHFLIEGLSRRDLRDESGSLWASKVGGFVQKAVRDYTEPDHGDFAQVPAVWAEQSTLDVLLGTYPQGSVSDKAVGAFEQAAGRLNRGEYAAAMGQYAGELATQGRYDKCVELLKAVDQLGELTPAERYVLAMSLWFLGRSGEAERAFDGFRSMPDGFYKDLALISGSSRSIDPVDRVAAARRVFSSDPVWDDKVLAWASVLAHGTYEERLEMARRFCALKAPTERVHLYAEGCLASEEGRWRDAIGAFRKAAQSAGEFPDGKMLYYSRLRPTVALSDDKELEAFIDDGLKDDDLAVLSHTKRAELDKQRGDDQARTADLRAALAHDPSPLELWFIVSAAGTGVADVRDGVRSVAEKHPYSWRARLVLTFLDTIEGDAAAREADSSASDLYREDPITYDSRIFELMEPMLNEGLLEGKVTQAEYRGRVELYFLTLLQWVQKFAFDAQLWSDFESYGLINERNDQVATLVAKYLPFKPHRMPKALRPTMMFLALNSGDSRTVRELVESGFDPSEGDDPRWLYAAYLSTRGDEQKALKMIDDLRVPDGMLGRRMEAMRTYLLAKVGKVDEARRRLTSEVDDFVVRGFDGLAWAVLGDWAKAEPLLLEQARSRNWSYLFVSEFAARTLDSHYRSSGRLNDAHMLALYAASSQPGNPLFDKFSFADKPGTEQFKGEMTLNCRALEDRSSLSSLAAGGSSVYFSGSLILTVDGVGGVTGSFTPEGGNAQPIRGKIDALGNLRGEGTWRDKPCALAGKLAPHGMYESFKEMRQVLELIDRDGFRILLVSDGAAGP